ncbi:hypothetical protein LSCM1_06075 [Leishmania martiniquensis]|uniref:Uncharacterized protein n=1 Tax=Leishmania martiniquensis TaxID=1580590 RepID=A0A836KLF3_9TRYP|nr:hypothetical protein LSCM1_06075 [Leishmania martiniquensis]
MKHFRVVSRRCTLWCVAVVLLFLSVTLACVRAQEDVAPSATATHMPAADGASTTKKTTAATAAAPAGDEAQVTAAQKVAAARATEAGAEAAAVREREAVEQARREKEHHRNEARERARQERQERRRVAEGEERYRRAAEGRQRREELKRKIDSVDKIRFTATELPQGCAASVEEYLFRVHEKRKKTAAAVRDARSELNEARVHAPNKASKLEEQLARRLDDLLVYDMETLRFYGGSVPKTCIAESQAWLDAQPQPFSSSEYVQKYIIFYRLIAAHVRLLGQTALGVMNYILHSYTPAVLSYTKAAQHYYARAKAQYAELLPAFGEWRDVPVMDLAKKALSMVGYAAVPIGLCAAAGIVAVFVLPPMVAAVMIYECVYKVWIELFFAYYIFGMQVPNGIISAIKAAVAAAQRGDWAYISSSALEALSDLLVDADTVFYNAIVGLFLLVVIVAMCALFICVWCCLCIPGMRGRRKASPLKSAPRSASGSSNGSKKKAAATAAAATTAAKKKS